MVKPKPTNSRVGRPRKDAAARKVTRCDVAALILKAVCAYQDRKGISTIALKKELSALGIGAEANDRVIKRSINWLLKEGAIAHTTRKVTGAMGSFKRGDAAELIAVKLATESRRVENAKEKLTEKSEAATKAAKE